MRSSEPQKRCRFKLKTVPNDAENGADFRAFEKILLRFQQVIVLYYNIG
jgi:hypothetical protein